MAAQSESPWQPAAALQKIYNNIHSAFTNVRPYVGSIPTYPRGLWSWTMASNVPFGEFNTERFTRIAPELEYLTPGHIPSIFALPNFYRKKLKI